MSTPAALSATPPVRDRHQEIVDFLKLLGHGEFLDALAAARLEGERALEEVGKPAEITVKIKLAPHGGNKRVISFTVTTKLPKMPASATYCFATESGQYVENNPDQPDLPLNIAPFEEQRLVSAHTAP